MVQLRTTPPHSPTTQLWQARCSAGAKQKPGVVCPWDSGQKPVLPATCIPLTEAACGRATVYCAVHTFFNYVCYIRIGLLYPYLGRMIFNRKAHGILHSVDQIGLHHSAVVGNRCSTECHLERANQYLPLSYGAAG